MNKWILTSLILLIALPSYIVYGQGEQCPKLRIGVYLNSIFAADTTAGYLNEKHKKNFTTSEWVNEIETYLLETLNSAGYDNLEFFLPAANPGTEMDLEFRFSLYPWSVDGEEKIPPYEVKYVDPVTGWEVTEYRAPVYDQETAFLMFSSLVVCSPCVPLMTYIISIEKAVEEDIYQLIKNLIYHYNWPLDKRISDWETKHPAPARKPEMEIRYEKEYLSLLNEESRKMEVYIKVKNCHGEYVFDKFHGQPVYFLKEMERLEYKDDPGNRCQIGFDWGIFSTVFTSQDLGAIGMYKVKKGTESSKEKPRFKTCGIGNNSLIEHEGEIIVRGLELLVEPWRNTVHNGEKTTISIDLHETDPDGNKFPAIQQEVQVKVTGLVDGSISPLGKVTTDDMGVAWIDYKAGQQDKQVKITATFTPPGYPEEVKGEATINIRPLEYEATLTVSGHYKKTQSSSYNEASSTGVSDGTYSLNESREASFYVPLKFEYAYDVAIQNQRWEFYRPLDINLSSFSASLRIRDYTHAESKTGGFRQTITTTKTPVNRRIAAKDYLLQSNIILIIDKKTDKVVKIATGGFGVEFEWTGSVKATGREWSVDPPSEKPINRTDPVNEDDTFNAQPVEDLIPDPTYTSVSESVRKYMKDLGTPLPARIEIPEDEEIPEVEPDLLVKFGDGKTYFGGDGKKIVDNSEGPTIHREEYNFSWQVTRKKKP